MLLKIHTLTYLFVIIIIKNEKLYTDIGNYNEVNYRNFKSKFRDRNVPPAEPTSELSRYRCKEH